MLRAVDLAVELSSLGARVVVVGSAAQWLASPTGTPEPRDLDVVVAREDVPDLVAAVQVLGGDLTLGRLDRCVEVHVDTAWGPLDVFVGPPPPSLEVAVDGVAVRVAA